MADQCIVCLENLDTESSAVAAPQHPSEAAGCIGASVPPQQSSPAEPAVAPAAVISAAIDSYISPNQHENHDNVALIEVCGHVLHDSCLRSWSEKANSCPICRQLFNLVHIYDKVGGTLLSSRVVEDKKQVAEFDAQAWIDENPDEEEIAIPCPICNLADQEDVLLICDGCDTPYHTHCIGLDDVPHGSWFCMECVEVLGIENAPQSPPPAQGNRLYTFPRTQARVRRLRRSARSDEWQGAWGRIAGQIWDALSLDLDYHEDENEDLSWTEDLRRTQRRRERERQEHQRWQQRLNIASRLGAGSVFARNIPHVLQGRAIPASRPPPQEPREVQMAWGAFEKARDSENRKRKSRSGTAEPNEAQQEPERKLKRPRTRRLPHQNGESSSSAANAAGPSTIHEEQVAPATSPGPSATNEIAPSFLSSLLKEVEMSTPSDEEGMRAMYGRIPGANDAVVSPVGSPSPRSASTTPPPNRLPRPISPHMTLSSHIAPIYPPANYSPTRSSSPTKHSRSSSPNKRAGMEGPSSPENSDSEPRGRRNGTTELRQPRPRRTAPIVVPRAARSEDTSPARSPLPLEVKENITSIVRSALKPHWRSSRLTAEQYAAINRDISRKLYEQVQDPSAAVGDETRHTWESLATKEVARAVSDLKA